MNCHVNLESVTEADIEHVLNGLSVLSFSYRDLLEASLSMNYGKTKESAHRINLDGTEISAELLHQGKTDYVITVPKSFHMAPSSIILHNNNKGMQLIACRKISDNAVDFTKEVLLKCKEPIPDGYVLIKEIYVDAYESAFWLNLIGKILQYYIAAVEPFACHRVISPTLDGCNRFVMAMRFSGKMADCIPKIMQDYISVYDDFQLAIYELRREAIRRTGRIKPYPVGKNGVHPSGFANPSGQIKIGKAAEMIGLGRGTAATKKMNRCIKGDCSGFVSPVPTRNQYYWFDRDHPIFENFPPDRSPIKK